MIHKIHRYKVFAYKIYRYKMYTQNVHKTLQTQMQSSSLMSSLGGAEGGFMATRGEDSSRAFGYSRDKDQNLGARLASSNNHMITK